MALVLKDRVQETATANTTVSFTMAGAVTGFQSFASIGNTNTTYYSAFDASGNWEVGIGTYSTTGPTLTRTTIQSSSNSGSAVTFSGTVNVFVTYPSEDAVYGNSTTIVAPSGALLPIASGGTGQTTASAAFNALSPLATAGDTLYGGTSGAGTRLAIGTAGQVLTVNSGATAPQWSTPTTGTVTSVTGTAPVVSSGGATPAISMAAANTTTNGYLTSTDWNTFNGKGSGTVTSVSFTGGLITVATATTTPALTVAGTSGGIPYFASGSTWASSAALTQYGIVYGGGAGATPVATAAGTTGQVLTATTGGAPTWAAASSGTSIGLVRALSVNCIFP